MLITQIDSRTGSQFVAAIDRDDEDGSLSIATRASFGWRSAHRDYAQTTLKGRILRALEHQFVGRDGELCVATTWERK